jgi:hypothetical protein
VSCGLVLVEDIVDLGLELVNSSSHVVVCGRLLLVWVMWLSSRVEVLKLWLWCDGVTSFEP